MTVTPSAADFAARYDRGEAQLLVRRVVDDLTTPVAALLALGPEREDVFLLESVQGGDWRGRYSVIGAEPDLIWRVREGLAETAHPPEDGFIPDDRPPLESLRAVIAGSAIDLAADLPPPAAGLFGYLGYDMVRCVERLPHPPADPLGLPQARLARPTLIAIFDSVGQEILLCTPVRPNDALSADAAYAAACDRLDRFFAALTAPVSPERRPRTDIAPRALTPTPSRSDADVRATVETCKRYIHAGDAFQIVPSLRYSAQLPASAFALYRSLRRLNPSPFLFYLNLPGFSVVGSSPEILVRVRDGAVTVRPIAGTRPRGATPAEDARLETDLLADPKERAEHLMLLDLGRNDVGRVAERGSVRVTESFAVERYSQVMHIVSNVEGTLKPDCDAVDGLMAAFPAGTVSGAPKVRAMEIIDEVEPIRRGLFYGAIGYVSAGGDLDTCIALRTGVVKDGALYVQAGGGVVADSDPETERLETVHKSSALFRAAAEAARFDARDDA
ncbi:MAG: anthranilate synthase component I family protein [Maricaulaceae bacterium]